jgi:putative membrane protein insertion efficiency factor
VRDGVKMWPQKFSTFVLLSLIRAYQILISPVLVPACRFHPSCSRYMLEAVELHGPLRGGVMGLRRLLRCHPFRKGGYDPVPE